MLHNASRMLQKCSIMPPIKLIRNSNFNLDIDFNFDFEANTLTRSSGSIDLLSATALHETGELGAEKMCGPSRCYHLQHGAVRV